MRLDVTGIDRGRFCEDELVALLTGARYPVRNVVQNVNDLKAQIAACRVAALRMEELAARHGADLRTDTAVTALTADAAGVTYRGAFGRKVFPWDGLEIKRTTTRHWGRESVLLELTRGDDLLFLGRWELGEAPTLVAQQLEALRPA